MQVDATICRFGRVRKDRLSQPHQDTHVAPSGGGWRHLSQWIRIPPLFTISTTLVRATIISGENYPEKFLTDLFSSTPVHQNDLLIPSSDHVTSLLKTQELLFFSLTVKKKVLTTHQRIYPLLSPLESCRASCSSSDHLTHKSRLLPSHLPPPLPGRHESLLTAMFKCQHITLSSQIENNPLPSILYPSQLESFFFFCNSILHCLTYYIFTCVMYYMFITCLPLLLIE